MVVARLILVTYDTRRDYVVAISTKRVLALG